MHTGRGSDIGRSLRLYAQLSFRGLCAEVHLLSHFLILYSDPGLRLELNHGDTDRQPTHTAAFLLHYVSLYFTELGTDNLCLKHMDFTCTSSFAL